MRLSKGHWQTYKETPAEAEVPSHKLMLRAGLLSKSASGLYSYLPMGLRSIKKMETIVRYEHDRVGCYELCMNIFTPAELWEESGRLERFGEEMLKIQDRYGRELCVSPTNEEAIVDIFRKEIKSYKQLPVTYYQINTKFRDEIRPKYGIIRPREFSMKDAYSFHIDWECLERTYEKMFRVYERIWQSIGLKFIAVRANAGAMADSDVKTHEFQVLAQTGEDRIIHCKSCGYAANIEQAQTYRKINKTEARKKLEKIDTPNIKTINELSNLLKIDQTSCLKSVVYLAITGNREEFVLVLLLGDDEVNELKLKIFLDCDHVKQASEGDLARVNLPGGFIGPIGIDKKRIKVLYDKNVDLNSSYATGALEKDTHFLGFVPARDDDKHETVDLRLSKERDNCHKCKKDTIEEIKGIEVGHIFQLGDKYTKSMNVTVLDNKGNNVYPIMGCYGMGPTRTVGAAIEQNYDKDGIIWPVAIAPYHLYFVVITKNEEIKKLADNLYEELLEKGIEVVYDDRQISPGVKFKDADLLGLPLRLVLGERDYQKNSKLEIKDRRTGQVDLVAIEDVANIVHKRLKEKLKAEDLRK